jgi:hypothetical protein
MKGVVRADQYLNNFSILRKTVKYSEKVMLYLVKCTLFHTLFACKTLNKNQNKHELAWSWISQTRNPAGSSSDELL